MALILFKTQPEHPAIVEFGYSKKIKMWIDSGGICYEPPFAVGDRVYRAEEWVEAPSGKIILKSELPYDSVLLNNNAIDWQPVSTLPKFVRSFYTVVSVEPVRVYDINETLLISICFDDEQSETLANNHWAWLVNVKEIK